MRALVRHVVGQDLRNFLDSALGQAADWQAAAVELGADWAGGFGAGAELLLDAWRRADIDPAKLGGHHRAQGQCADAPVDSLRERWTAEVPAPWTSNRTTLSSTARA